MNDSGSESLEASAGREPSHKNRGIGSYHDKGFKISTLGSLLETGAKIGGEVAMDGQSLGVQLAVCALVNALPVEWGELKIVGAAGFSRRVNFLLFIAGRRTAGRWVECLCRRGRGLLLTFAISSVRCDLSGVPLSGRAGFCGSLINLNRAIRLGYVICIGSPEGVSSLVPLVSGRVELVGRGFCGANFLRDGDHPCNSLAAIFIAWTL